MRFPIVRSLTLVGAVATLASVVGAVAPSLAYAGSGSTQLSMSVDAPASLPYRSTGELTIALAPADPTATGELVVTTAPTSGGPDVQVLDQTVAASDGPFTVPIVADTARGYTVTFTPDNVAWLAPTAQSVVVGTDAVPTDSSLVVTGSPASGAAVKPGPTVWRTFGGVATMTLLDSDGVPVVGQPVTLQMLIRGTIGTLSVNVATVSTSSAGIARVAVNPLADVTYRMVYTGSAGRLSPSRSGSLLVRPAIPGLRVPPPAGSPQPASIATPLGLGTGTGAYAVISAIPNAVWASMVGYSWHSGCPVGRSQLSYILVNYWGFDGNRYRGELVVVANRATAFARAFTTLYNSHFPIRSMVRPDRFGHSPNGWPGANDYSSMSHDNTYAFNCRYVVGAESSHRMSPHSYGSAVDINTWENPDRAANGTHPNSWFWSHRSSSYGGVIMKGSTVVVTMRAAGLGWGGTSIGDLQHFDPSLL